MSNAVSPQNAPTQSNVRQVKPTFGAPVVRAPTNLSAMDRIRGLSSRPWLLRQGIQEKCTSAAAKKQRTCRSVTVLIIDSPFRDSHLCPSAFSRRLIGIIFAGIQIE